MQEQIIIVIFPSRRILVKALDHLLEVAVDIRQAAVIAKSQTGKILVLNDDLSGDDGGLVGGIAGAVIGALAVAGAGLVVIPGNLLTVLAVGALIGGVVGGLVGRLIASTMRFGFARPYVNAIADRLQTGNSALMLRVEDAATLLPKLKNELEPYRAELIEQLRELQSTIKSK